MSRDAAEVAVWDPLVRFGHWLLVASVAAAWLSEGEPEWLHVNAGYVAGGYVLLRILWGFVGPRHARFSDFVTSPGAGLRYLLAMPVGRAPRYLGHSPAGGWMVLMLMASVLATAASGLVLYGQEGEGPLAGIIGQSQQERGPVSRPPYTESAAASREGEDADDDHEHGDHEESLFEELHEFFGNLILVLAGFHVAGVLLASRSHHENLTRAMVTGRKPVDPD